MARSKVYSIFATFVAMLVLSSCAITRTETDYYTITVRDTTYREAVRNVPGSSEDNGVVYPSSRTTFITNVTTTYDSLHERRYPNFMRAGGIEFAGLMLTSSLPGIGPGFLGVYGIADSNTINEIGSVFNPKPRQDIANKLFKGNLLRVFPYEYRLRWFDDAADWTIGTSLVEIINKDENNGFASYPFLNAYIRKRFYFKDNIPYLFAAPYVGVSLAPSMYANLGSELVFGSFGGFNLRAYVGMASGFNWNFSGSSPTKAITFPYVGLGISALDFINKVEETEREWFEYVHSAIEVTVLDAQLIKAFADYTNAFDTTVAVLPFTGGAFRFATAHFPLEAFGSSNWWVGTSLFQYLALGFEQSTFSVLPLRGGYRMHLIAEDLSFEPFIELNYYPSQYLNLGARLRLNTFTGVNIGIVGGYANGTSGAFLPNAFFEDGSPFGSDFSSVYAGLSIGINSTLFMPDFVWRSKASEK